MKNKFLMNGIAMLLICLMAVGCSSGSSAGAPSPSGAAGPAAASSSVGDGGVVMLQSQAMPSSGANYGYMVEFVKAIEEYYGEKYDITVREGAGSEDCIRSLHAGLVEMGQTDLITAYQAVNGMPPFEGDPATELRGMAVKRGAIFQFAVAEDSGVNSIWELDGKPYVVGGIGSGSESQINELFEAVGIHPDTKRGTLDDAKAMYADRQIIGFQWTDSGLAPTPAFIEGHSARPLKILSFDDRLIEGFLKSYPFAIKEMEPGVYPWMTEPVKSLAGVSGISCTDKMDPQAVYDIVKAYWETADIWGKSYPDQVVPVENSVKEMTIYLHPGAIKYYEEIGLEIPDHLIPPEGKWNG